MKRSTQNKQLQQSSQLNGTAAKIREAHAYCERAVDDAVSHAVRAGELLQQAKEQCGHGNWGRWVEKNCGFSLRTAQTYMKFFDNREQLPKAQRAALLSMRGVTKVTAKRIETRPAESPSADGLPETFFDAELYALLNFHQKCGVMAEITDFVDGVFKDAGRLRRQLEARMVGSDAKEIEAAWHEQFNEYCVLKHKRGIEGVCELVGRAMGNSAQGARAA